MSIRIPELNSSELNRSTNKSPYWAAQPFRHIVKIGAGDDLIVGTPTVEDTEVPLPLRISEVPEIITEIELVQTGTEIVAHTVFIYDFINFEFFIIGAMRGSIADPPVRPTAKFSDAMPTLVGSGTKGLKRPAFTDLYFAISEPFDNDAMLIVTGNSYRHPING